MDFSNFVICKPVKKQDVFISTLQKSPSFTITSTNLTLKEYPLRICVHDFDKSLIKQFLHECAVKLSEDLVVWFGAESSVEDLLDTMVFDHNFDDPNIFEVIVHESCYDSIKHILRSQKSVFMNQQLHGTIEFCFPEIHFFQDKAMLTGICGKVELKHDDSPRLNDSVPQPFYDDLNFVENNASVLLKKKQQEIAELSKMEKEMQNKINQVNSKMEALTFEMDKISSLKRTS